MNIGQDANGDIDVQNGQLVLVGFQFGTQLREIEEHLEQRLRTLSADWFLDTSLGIPYFEEVFQKPFNASVVESIFINEILSTPGVIRLIEFNMDFSKANRQLQVTFTAESTAGVIVFNEELP